MKQIGIISLCAVLLGGCSLLPSPVPTTQIKGRIGGQEFSIENPKNTTLSNLSVTVGTNGAATLTIGTLNSVNDPTVISNAAAGQAAIVQATGNAIVSGINAAATGAGAFAGAAAKAP